MTDLAALTEFDFETLARHLDRAQRMSNSGSWESDIIAKGLIWSPQIFRIFGLSPNEFTPTYTAFLERVHPDDRHVVERGVQRALEGIEPYEVDHRIILPDGAVRVVHEKGEVEFAPDGTAVRMLGAVADVTELRASSLAAKTDNEMLGGILQLSLEAIIVTDAAGAIRLFSVEAQEMYGYSSDEATDLGLDDLTPAHLRDPYARRVDEFVRDRSRSVRLNERSEIFGLRKNGEEFPVDISLAKLETEGGYAFMVLARDLSEVKANERRLVEARERAERALMAAKTARSQAERSAAEHAESEARYRLLADNASDIILQFDLANVVVYASPSVRQLGYEPDEVVGLATADLVHPEDLDGSRTRMAAVLAGQVIGPAERSERRIRAKDGRWLWVEGSPTLLRDDQGAAIGLVTTLRDITARREMEDELRRKSAETETLLREVMEADRTARLAETLAGVGYWRADTKASTTTWSPSIFGMFGLDPAKGVPPGGVSNMFDPEHRDLLRKQLQGLAKGSTPEAEYAFTRGDGERRYVRMIGATERDAAGQIAAVYGVILDVTEARRRERALTESEARYRLLAENASDIIIRLDMAGVIEFVSPSVRRWGYEPRDVVGRNVAEFLHPEDVADTISVFQVIASGQTPSVDDDFEVRIRTAAGEWAWSQGPPAPILDEAGKVVGIVAILRDVTERRAAQQIIAESEARYRMITDRATDLIVRYDTNGVIEFVSPSVRQLGYEPTELVGRNIRDFVNSSDLAEVEEDLSDYAQGRYGRAIRNGEENVVQVRRADGGWVWFEGAPALVDDDSGVTIGVVTVLRDINERRAAQQIIAESEARYRMITDRATDVILRYDINGVIEFASPSLRQIGYEPEEVIGRHVSLFWPPGELAGARTLEGLASGQPPPSGHFNEFQILRRDGGVVWMEGRPSSITDEAGKVIGVVTVVRDITERKMVEAELSASERKLRGLFDLSPLGIALKDMNGRYIEFNEAFREITGYSEAELKELDYRQLTPRKYEADDNIQLELMERHGRYGRYEKEYIRRDGTLIPLRMNGILVTGPDGDKYTWCIVEDISEQQRAEAVLIEARIAAEAAALAKSEFLANMSHELRTPLTGIVGFAGLLEQVEDLPPSAARFASRIVTAGQSLMSVVNDILDFSKLEAGQIELDPQPFDPRAFVVETLELVAGQAAKKGLRLRSEIVGELPPGVNADSSRLRQVLLNLLNNAIKFTDQGSVSLAVGYSADDGGRLRVSVSDTGVGIPEEGLGRLFQRFSQVDASTTRQYGGTGLGLAISKALVEVMGGDIGVESQVGVGSTFWFAIAAPPANLAAPTVNQDEHDFETAPARILVVDDVAVNRELVRTMLSPFFGHVVTEASGGAEAVKAAMHSVFDLILMDLQMPGVDGLAATRAIRATCRLNQATPIVAISANVLPENQDACRAAGMDDHISKPLDVAELLTKVSIWTTPAEATVGG